MSGALNSMVSAADRLPRVSKVAIEAFVKGRRWPLGHGSRRSEFGVAQQYPQFTDGLALACFFALAHDLGQAADDAGGPAVVPVGGVFGAGRLVR